MASKKCKIMPSASLDSGQLLSKMQRTPWALSIAVLKLELCKEVILSRFRYRQSST